MSTTQVETIKALMKQFGDSVPIKKIAEYAEAEYLIPYEVAVQLIYDLT